MRKLFLALGAVALAVPAAAVVVPAQPAEAKIFDGSGKASFEQQRRGKRYKYREWRGRDGRLYCRKSDGTTGLVIGAVGGALVGRTIDTGGDRSAGTLIGAVAGGLAGREIERSSSKRRCR